jgi:hypothetical protein
MPVVFQSRASRMPVVFQSCSSRMPVVFQSYAKLKNNNNLYNLASLHVFGDYFLAIHAIERNEAA